MEKGRAQFCLKAGFLNLFEEDLGCLEMKDNVRSGTLRTDVTVSSCQAAQWQHSFPLYWPSSEHLEHDGRGSQGSGGGGQGGADNDLDLELEPL